MSSARTVPARPTAVQEREPPAPDTYPAPRAGGARTARTISLVLPIHNQAEYIGSVVEDCLDVAQRVSVPVELVLVANGCSDDSPAICQRLAAGHEQVRALTLATGGWGRAVRAGLAACSGDTVGYTNSARTSPQTLALMLCYAQVYPDAMLKVKRRLRDNARRQLGSLLFNVECRLLFDLASWDVNGTPKLFPRAFTQLFRFIEERELIDAELLAICRREGYPVIEVPVLATERRGGISTTTYATAARMYSGAIAMRRRLRRA